MKIGKKKQRKNKEKTRKNKGYIGKLELSRR